MHGYSRAEVEAGRLTWRDLTPAEYVEISEQQLGELRQIGRIELYEKEYLHIEITTGWSLSITGRSVSFKTHLAVGGYLAPAKCHYEFGAYSLSWPARR